MLPLGEVVPERIYPVFRDEVELSASPDLNASIERALDRSRCLLVLASPGARESKYVDQEVRTFRRGQNGANLLVAILEGEPDESFPEAVRFGVDAEGAIDRSHPLEPIAADFRLRGNFAQGWTTPGALREALQRAGERPSAIVRKVREYDRHLELTRLKIIAGVLGLPLEQLARRDRAYQLLLSQRRARV